MDARGQKLKVAAAMLAEPFSKHLGTYFRNLLPVLTTLAEQAGGAPQDDDFWGSTQKWEDESGGPMFNGWTSARRGTAHRQEAPKSPTARHGQAPQPARHPGAAGLPWLRPHRPRPRSRAGQGRHLDKDRHIRQDAYRTEQPE